LLCAPLLVRPPGCSQTRCWGCRRPYTRLLVRPSSPPPALLPQPGASVLLLHGPCVPRWHSPRPLLPVLLQRCWPSARRWFRRCCMPLSRRTSSSDPLHCRRPHETSPQCVCVGACLESKEFRIICLRCLLLRPPLPTGDLARPPALPIFAPRSGTSRALLDSTFLAVAVAVATCPSLLVVVALRPPHISARSRSSLSLHLSLPFILVARGRLLSVSLC
jgi:hypothetical protein